ncbi:hypothetical protein N9T65_00700 [Candidatus Pelagibacter sp.]|nr:hypothetical protein [Candidatus Pelagibacter sp.]MDA9663379.1 hypothetical protein [Candidatus Pelagibacter sp.]
MKKIFYTIFLVLFLNISIADDNLDCSKFKKISKEYLSCKTDNVKSKSKEFTIIPDLKNLSEKKTLADIFKKKNN